MKSKSCIIWVLGAVMMAASIDTIPDPPAVNPHTVSVASRLREARGSVCERRLDSDCSCACSHVQIRWIAFKSAYEPTLPNDLVALTAFAADPSPPAYGVSRNPFVRS
jgi:hypothetical protein